MIKSNIEHFLNRESLTQFIQDIKKYLKELKNKQKLDANMLKCNNIPCPKYFEPFQKEKGKWSKICENCYKNEKQQNKKELDKRQINYKKRLKDLLIKATNMEINYLIKFKDFYNTDEKIEEYLKQKNKTLYKLILFVEAIFRYYAYIKIGYELNIISIIEFNETYVNFEEILLHIKHEKISLYKLNELLRKRIYNKKNTPWIEHRARKYTENPIEYRKHLAKIAKEWRQNNIDRVIQWNIKRNKNPICRLNSLKRQAYDKGRKFELSDDEAYLLIKDKCYYCGEVENDAINGIDRVDSNGHYTLDN